MIACLTVGAFARLTRRMTPAILVASVLSATLPSTASAASSTVKTIENGKLTYGTASSFAPFEFVKDGTLTGFDIDLIDAIAAKMALSTAPQQMNFNGLIPALQGGRLDIINSGMYITPVRAQQVDFIPYLRLGDSVIVQKGNPQKITGRDNSVCGKTLAVTLGGIEETYAREDTQRCQAAGLSAPTVQTLPTAQDTALNLRQGRADVMYDSTPGAVQLMDSVPDTFQTVGKEFEQTTSIGIAVQKGNVAMADAIKTAMEAVVKDGTYQKLIRKWKLPTTVSIFK